MAHLLELQALAMSLSLPTYLVQDAGLTQVRETGHFQSSFVCKGLLEAPVITPEILSKYIWSDTIFDFESAFACRCENLTSKSTLLVSSGGVWVSHCPGHHG